MATVVEVSDGVPCYFVPPADRVPRGVISGLKVHPAVARSRRTDSRCSRRFSARLLTNAPLPDWLKEPEEVKAAAREAAKVCEEEGAAVPPPLHGA